MNKQTNEPMMISEAVINEFLDPNKMKFYPYEILDKAQMNSKAGYQATFETDNGKKFYLTFFREPGLGRNARKVVFSMQKSRQTTYKVAVDRGSFLKILGTMLKVYELYKDSDDGKMVSSYQFLFPSSFEQYMKFVVRVLNRAFRTDLRKKLDLVGATLDNDVALYYVNARSPYPQFGGKNFDPKAIVENDFYKELIGEKTADPSGVKVAKGATNTAPAAVPVAAVVKKTPKDFDVSFFKDMQNFDSKAEFNAYLSKENLDFEWVVENIDQISRMLYSDTVRDENTKGVSYNRWVYGLGAIIKEKLGDVKWAFPLYSIIKNNVDGAQTFYVYKRVVKLAKFGQIPDNVKNRFDTWYLKTMLGEMYSTVMNRNTGYSSTFKALFAISYMGEDTIREMMVFSSLLDKHKSFVFDGRFNDPVFVFKLTLLLIKTTGHVLDAMVSLLSSFGIKIALKVVSGETFLDVSNADEKYKKIAKEIFDDWSYGVRLYNGSSAFTTLSIEYKAYKINDTQIPLLKELTKEEFVELYDYMSDKIGQGVFDSLFRFGSDEHNAVFADLVNKHIPDEKTNPVISYVLNRDSDSVDLFEKLYRNKIQPAVEFTFKENINSGSYFFGSLKELTKRNLVDFKQALKSFSFEDVRFWSKLPVEKFVVLDDLTPVFDMYKTHGNYYSNVYGDYYISRTEALTSKILNQLIDYCAANNFDVTKTAQNFIGTSAVADILKDKSLIEKFTKAFSNKPEFVTWYQYLKIFLVGDDNFITTLSTNNLARVISNYTEADGEELGKKLAKEFFKKVDSGDNFPVNSVAFDASLVKYVEDDLKQATPENVAKFLKAAAGIVYSDSPSRLQLVDTVFDVVGVDKASPYFDSLDKEQRSAIAKQLVAGRVMSDALESITASDAPIKPLIQLTKERVLTMLKYNGFSTPRVIVKDDTTLEDVMKRYEKVKMSDQFKVPEQKVTEEALDEKQLRRRSVEYDAFNKRKHGSIAVKILKSFNVSIPIQQEGFDKFVNELQTSNVDPGIIKPMFHGSGSCAASMILRYGFAVIKEGDSSITGRMLGPGIYISNVLDKVAQYVVDSGYARTVGEQGYIFEMEAALGIPKTHTVAAGTNSKYDIRGGVISPEWAVKQPNEQLRIYKAHLVEVINQSEMDEMKAKTLNENEKGGMIMIKAFKDVINEAVGRRMGSDMKDKVTYVFPQGKIPVSNNKTVDFQSYKPGKKGVVQDISAKGPTVVIDVPNGRGAIYYVVDIRDFMLNKPELDKFLRFTK